MHLFLQDIFCALPQKTKMLGRYGYTVQSSKDRSMFGKGDIRGVIGPESSANANYGGALIPTLIACIMLLVRMRLAPETDPVFVDLEVGGADAKSRHGLWPTLFWFALLLALSGLFGFIIALTIFFLAFYRVRARLSWTGTLIYTAGGVAAMIAFGWLLGRDFPPGLLQQFAQRASRAERRLA